ncbi:transposase [Paraburkholderia nemoris]|uniref:transposase n=1 Tax=Paraburkholderia nemoris TaxID=2793076 RepID=UPI0038BC291F
MISLYVPGGDLKAQFINAKIRTPGVSGREPTYTTAYIELIFTFYRLFGWGIRQITGYIEDYWTTRALDIPVPSASQLGERFASLEVGVIQRCEQLVRQLARGEAVSLIVDSTGLSFGRASEWYEQKYGRKERQTPWRKMHLSIDPDMNVHAMRITAAEVSDSEAMDAVLPAEVPLDRVIADGAYYSIERKREFIST